MHIATYKPLSRRTFLRGAGALVALPMLNAMTPSVFAQSAAAGKATKRLIAITNPFGFFPPEFFPKEAGPNYTLPKLLEPFAKNRNDFTVFSHLDHGLTGGHHAVHTFISGVKSPEAKGYADGCISLDQVIAAHVGPATRFPSLNLGNNNISWTRNAIENQSIGSMEKLYDALFLDPDEEAKRKMHLALKLDASVLDSVNAEAKMLAKKLGPRDRDKLDQYFTGIRELEIKMKMSERWIDEPKPKVDYKLPDKTGTWKDYEAFVDLIALAIETDSTRAITFGANYNGLDTFFGTEYSDYHKYSHHGKLEALYTGLLKVETFQTVQVARLVDKLKSSADPINGGNLLDHTMVLLGSGMADGSSHTNKDMPILLAGGGFKHGEHKVYPEESGKRVPLCNLYLSMLQKMGIPKERFGTSTGTLVNFS